MTQFERMKPQFRKPVLLKSAKSDNALIVDFIVYAINRHFLPIGAPVGITRKAAASPT